MTCLVIHEFPMPSGLSPAAVDLMVRLPPGYPDVPPDMFWCAPHVSRDDGGYPVAADVTETHLGRPWQRFSRHLPPGQWRPGTDGLQSYLRLVVRELEKAAAA